MATEPLVNSPTILDDGSIAFKIRKQDGTETEHTIDLMILQMTCEECVAAHQLQVAKDGRYVRTPAFLVDLSKRIQAIGLEQCTPTLANKLWVAAYEGFEALKKSTSETQSLDSGSGSIPEDSASESESAGWQTSTE